MDTKSQEQQQPSFFRKIQTDDGEIPFLQDIWGFFSKKGIKTQFYSFFSDKSFKLDLELCESLGCPINIYLTNDETVAKWETIKSTLKNRKIADEDKDKTWLQGLEKKWILPKNILVKKQSVEWTTLRSEVEAHTENRLDILKIEGVNDAEHILLYSMLESGFRPGLVLVRFTEDPDANVPSMLVAGHLQMSGYKLAEVNNNWFLYLYTDVCLYETCSWRNTKTQNPVAYYLAELLAPKTTPEEKHQETPQQTPQEPPLQEKKTSE
jgi:hypothetical protein